MYERETSFYKKKITFKSRAMHERETSFYKTKSSMWHVEPLQSNMHGLSKSEVRCEEREARGVDSRRVNFRNQIIKPFFFKV